MCGRDLVVRTEVAPDLTYRNGRPHEEAGFHHRLPPLDRHGPGCQDRQEDRPEVLRLWREFLILICLIAT